MFYIIFCFYEINLYTFNTYFVWFRNLPPPPTTTRSPAIPSGSWSVGRLRFSSLRCVWYIRTPPLFAYQSSLSLPLPHWLIILFILLHTLIEYLTKTTTRTTTTRRYSKILLHSLYTSYPIDFFLLETRFQCPSRLSVRLLRRSFVLHL